ncbi:hypothetical protein ACQ4PT_066728 [Festuca glaucescens]
MGDGDGSSPLSLTQSLRVDLPLPAPLPFPSGGLAGRSGEGRGGRAVPVDIRVRFILCVAPVANGVMPSWSFFLASTSGAGMRRAPSSGRRSWRTVAGSGSGRSSFPFNKLVCLPDLVASAIFPSYLNHRGDGEEADWVQLCATIWEGVIQAALFWCSPSVALRWLFAVLLLTTLAERRPFGESTQTAVHQLFCWRRSFSSSRQEAQSGGSCGFSSACCNGNVPSGYVPGGDAAGRAMKLFIIGDMEWWSRARLRFSYSV